MIKLNRTTEYGLIALRHMSRKQALESERVTSAREIADYYGFPFEITAKTLLRLKDSGLIQSEQGARGGYSLKRGLAEISLIEFLEMMEGPQSVVACAGFTPPGESLSCSCDYHARCEVKGMMAGLNQRIVHFLSGIYLADLTDCPVMPPIKIEKFEKLEKSALGS